MSKSSHRVHVIIDDKKIITEAKAIQLKIDGLTVYKSANIKLPKDIRLKPQELQVLSVQTLLEAANAVFGHADRFKMVKLVKESPKSFTEIKKLLHMTSPTVNYHLKRLVEGLIIYKVENEKYAVTILGELLLEFFSGFLQQVEKLGNNFFSGEKPE